MSFPAPGTPGYNPVPAPPGVPPQPPYPNDQPQSYYIPPRKVFYDDADPRPHTSLRQVKALLLGQDLSVFADPDPCVDPDPNFIIGGCCYTTLFGTLVPLWIQQVTDYVVQELRTSFDWVYRVWMADGTGSNEMTLPDRNIRDVLACFIRVLPSNVWYAFNRFRKVGGEEYWNIGGVVGYPVAAETLPPQPLDAATAFGTVYPTGIEDADLLVDVRRRTVKIPPRVLYAGINVPLWNYVFNAGPLNIEFHYSMGFPPTKYTDGSPLQFTAGDLTAMPPVIPAVIEPKPGAPNVLIDWASNMPTALTMAVAQLVANYVLRQKWRAQSDGVTSLGVDGANESYGSSPYGGDLDKQSEEIMKNLLSKYAIQVVI